MLTAVPSGMRARLRDHTRGRATWDHPNCGPGSSRSCRMSVPVRHDGHRGLPSVAGVGLASNMSNVNSGSDVHIFRDRSAEFAFCLMS